MPRRLSSSCRQFRRQHAEFVDGYLSDEAQRAGREHLDECPVCARHDVQIRRSLMALQSLPMIEPSAGFHNRLCERLAREAIHYSPVPSRHVRWGMATVVAVASAALLFTASSHSRQTEAIRRTPVMAYAPTAPILRRSVSGLAGRDVAASNEATLGMATKAPVVTAGTAIHSHAGLEVLPRRDAAQSRPLLQQGLVVRLQAVSYIGQ
jgi:anti-sigma factor RsiW